MTNDAKDIDLRKWSVEGLAFLTLDAAIKEQLINDTQAIQAIIDVAKVMFIYVLTLDSYSDTGDY